MSIDLFEHNKKAYDAAIDMIERKGKAVIVHPTGTGKSFIGFKYVEDNKDKRIVWLTPSEHIVRTQLENIKRECGNSFDNIIFITYARLMMMTLEEKKSLKPDAIIMDEFHRGGASCWGGGIADLISLFPKCPMLGLSATHIRYLDNQRDMASELFDGNIASEMTLGEAIARNILLPPKYVLSVYAYQNDIKNYQERISRIKNPVVRTKNQHELDALKRALEAADGVDMIFKKHMDNKHGKYIVFCSSRENLDEMIDLAENWFGGIDSDMHIYRVYSEDASSSKEFDSFKSDSSDHLRLLYCIDMLNEGVHVDDIDGVILLRPTVSPIIYKQQIGRALSANKNKQPVIFDIVNNFESLYSISSIQSEINLAVSYYREHGEEYKIINESFNIIDKTADCRSLFESLEHSLASSWEMYFEEARLYFEKYGNLNVPHRYITETGMSLGSWIQTQKAVRHGRTNGILTDEQIKKLDSIGMIWDNVNELRWEEGFKHAKAYYEKYGDLNVKAQYICDDGYRLGSWITNNRTWYSNNSVTNVLTSERVKRLEEIGMIWNKSNTVWELYYNEAAKYSQTHGNLNIPAEYVSESGIKLGSWINRQKQLRNTKDNSLSKEQQERLEMIGMVWENKYELRWNISYDAACKYYKENGNLNVPTSYKTNDGISLGRWVRKQREKHKSGTLTQNQIKKLDSIKMRWSKAENVS